LFKFRPESDANVISYLSNSLKAPDGFDLVHAMVLRLAVSAALRNLLLAVSTADTNAVDDVSFRHEEPRALVGSRNWASKT
jgi:hypothetical protein